MFFFLVLGMNSFDGTSLLLDWHTLHVKILKIKVRSYPKFLTKLSQLYNNLWHVFKMQIITISNLQIPWLKWISTQTKKCCNIRNLSLNFIRNFLIKELDALITPQVAHHLMSLLASTFHSEHSNNPKWKSNDQVMTNNNICKNK